MTDEKVNVYLEPFLESERKIDELLSRAKESGVYQKRLEEYEYAK